MITAPPSSAIAFGATRNITVAAKATAKHFIERTAKPVPKLKPIFELKDILAPFCLSSPFRRNPQLNKQVAYQTPPLPQPKTFTKMFKNIADYRFILSLFDKRDVLLRIKRCKFTTPRRPQLGGRRATQV